MLLVVGPEGSLVVEKCKVERLDGYARRVAVMERRQSGECCRNRSQRSLVSAVYAMAIQNEK